MLEKKEKYRTIILLVLDFLATIVALPLAYHLRINIHWIFGEGLLGIVHPVLYSFQAYLWFYFFSFFIIFFFFFYSSNYHPPHSLKILYKQILLIFEELLIITFLIGFYSFLFKLEISRLLIILFVIIVFLLQILVRISFVLFYRFVAGSGNGWRRIIIAGNSLKVFEIIEKIKNFKQLGYHVVGFVMDRKPMEYNSKNVLYLGNFGDFHEILEKHVVDEVIFISDKENNDLKIFERIALLCEEQGILTRLSLNFFPYAISKTSLDFIDNQPFLTFSPVPEQEFALMIKRLIDIVGAVVCLFLSIPFFLTIPILIKLTSRGPVIYKQIRCGLYGRKFTLYKFRSMIDGAEDILWEIKHLNEMNGPTFKMRNDPRVTSLGRILRKTSIDEIPQFFNVLKGEMSLVGPRAPLPGEVKEYTRWQKRRLSVKPGITCLWQISGRNEVDFHEWMKLDLEYIDNWSLSLDLKILILTIPTVLLCRGAR